MDRMSKRGFRTPRARVGNQDRAYRRGRLVLGCGLALFGAVGCAEWDGVFKPKQQGAPATDQEKPQSAPAPHPVEPVPPTASGELAEAPVEDGPTMRSVKDYLAQLEAAQNAPPPAVVDDPAPQRREGGTAPPPKSAPPASTPPMQAPVVLAAAAPQAATGPVAPQVHAVALLGDTELAAPAPRQEAVQLNRSMDTAAPVEDATLTRLIEQAARELRAAPGDADRQWRLSLLQIAAGRPHDALTLSPDLPIETRTRLTQTLKAMIAAGQLNGQTGAPPDEVLAAVNELGGALRRDAELRVPVVALCKKVVTFGVYDELPASALAAGRANRVIVYCEIENFSSERQDSGAYRTLLSSRLELFTAEGKSVWVAEEDKIEDQAKQKREDFFLAQLVTLPADLAAGEYVLKVTITDLAAGKTNEGVHRFRING